MQKNTIVLSAALLALALPMVSARASIEPSLSASAVAVEWEYAQVSFFGSGGECHDIDLRNRALILSAEDVPTFLKEVRERARGELVLPGPRFLGTSRRPVVGDQDILNLMGANGYELVNATVELNEAQRSLWIFKRPVP